MEQRMEGDNWWRKIGKEDEKDKDEIEEEEKENKDKNRPQKLDTSIPRYKSFGTSDLDDKREVKLNPSLKLLQDTRKGQTELDVEEEFKKAQEMKKMGISSKGPKKVQKQEYMDSDDELEDGFGIKREKSQCLLLNSQIAIIKELFEKMDKFNDYILRRSEFIPHLRTDEKVVDFIDTDAVKLAYSNRTLNLDEILTEIEKDETYEMMQMGKNSDQINHKEFLTWREFMTYFNDYREIDERNKRSKDIQRTRKIIQDERENTETLEDEVGTLLEQEKERRLLELPKLRPAD